MSRPHTWGFPGGILEEGESFLQGALRETAEETGGTPPPLRVVDEIRVRKPGGAPYVTFVCEFEHEDDAWRWEPVLDEENDEWGWFRMDDLPGELHWGVKRVLKRRVKERKRAMRRTRRGRRRNARDPSVDCAVDLRAELRAMGVPDRHVGNPFPEGSRFVLVAVDRGGMFRYIARLNDVWSVHGVYLVDTGVSWSLPETGPSWKIIPLYVYAVDHSDVPQTTAVRDALQEAFKKNYKSAMDAVEGMWALSRLVVRAGLDWLGADSVPEQLGWGAPPVPESEEDERYGQFMGDMIAHLQENRLL